MTSNPQPDMQMLDDMALFARHMLASRDLDPIYDVLKTLYGLLELDEEQRLWFTTLYLAYYDLTSALAAFRRAPTFRRILPERCEHLRCAVERRGLRGGKVMGHMLNYADHVAGYARNNDVVFAAQQCWVMQGWGGNIYANYEAFWETAQTIWGNGRWAAFKWADLLKNVHDYPIAAPDMRLAFCSGPKAGLLQLYGLIDASVSVLNDLGNDLMERMHACGLQLDWEQLETVLCNFHSLAAGRYYVGHDIDELQHNIETSDLSASDKALLWHARALALPHAYLGELRGWGGVSKDRKKIYHDMQLILSMEPR